jgi:hypothetical protein
MAPSPLSFEPHLARLWKYYRKTIAVLGIEVVHLWAMPGILLTKNTPEKIKIRK